MIPCSRVTAHTVALSHSLAPRLGDHRHVVARQIYPTLRVNLFADTKIAVDVLHVLLDGVVVGFGDQLVGSPYVHAGNT